MGVDTAIMDRATSAFVGRDLAIRSDRRWVMSVHMEQDSRSCLARDSATEAPSQVGGIRSPLFEQMLAALEKPGSGAWATQRSSMRHAILAPVLLWRSDDRSDANVIRAQIVNMSVGGLGLLLGESLVVGERVVLELSLDGVGLVWWRLEACWLEERDDGLFHAGFRIAECCYSADGG
jgi:PilZ domain-containing protein